MPRREDEYWAGDKENLRYCSKHKRYYRADVGCQLCGYEHLELKRQEADASRLQKCPKCGKEALFWNESTELYECLNLKCKRRFTQSDLKSQKSFPSPAHVSRGRDRHSSRLKTPRLRNMSHRFRATTRRLKAFWRNLPKVLILVVALATTAIVVSTVCQFVTGNLKLSSVLLFSIFGLGILMWDLKSISRHRLSFVGAFMALLISCLFIIVSSAYLDIRSPGDVRDNIMAALTTEKGQFRSTVDLIVERAELKVVDIASAGQETVEEMVEEIATTNYVHVDGGILVGADGHYITLRNNPDATNLSWEELKAFLLKDRTDSNRYDIETFVCAEFAEMLHNNAEVAGIKAAFVAVRLGPCSYYSLSGGHALNAFETTDRGLVYIDCTSSNQGVNADKIVEVQVGKDYIPRSIFPEPGWSAIWETMGVVKEIEVVKW